jgi:hypothetical protein
LICDIKNIPSGITGYNASTVKITTRRVS